MNLWVVADHTLREAVRRRVVLAATVVIGGFLALYAVGVWFGYRDISTDPNLTVSMRQVIAGFMLQGGLWSLNFVASLLAVFLAVGSISGEIDQGTMHAVAARPVRRAHIVLGKFLGNLMLLTVFIGVSTAIMIATVAIITGQYPARAWLAPFGMLFAAAVLLAVTIAGSTRFGTLANGVVAVTLYAVALVGGVIEQIGGLLDNPVTFDIGIATSVLLPTRGALGPRQRAASPGSSVNDESDRGAVRLAESAIRLDAAGGRGARAGDAGLRHSGLPASGHLSRPTTMPAMQTVKDGRHG